MDYIGMAQVLDLMNLGKHHMTRKAAVKFIEDYLNTAITELCDTQKTFRIKGVGTVNCVFKEPKPYRHFDQGTRMSTGRWMIVFNVSPSLIERLNDV